MVSEDEPEAAPAPAHHPSPPPDELFDISTTVDPSYIISLIRKLIPGDVRNNGNSNTGVAAKDEMEVNSSYSSKNVDVIEDLSRGGGDVEVWEESGCVLWDLAASKSHAELMVQNLILDVLKANLMVSQSDRAKEICLGIIGNLACHEVLMKNIISTEGLVELIVDQLFLDDTQCLCEACRLLTLGLQVGECTTWAKGIESEQILCRIMWIAENTLNPLLLEKIIGLILAILESKEEVSCILLPSLLKLGLPTLLISLLAFEMSSLTGERVPERYPVLDVILRVIEVLSTLDGHSQEICSDSKLLQLVCDLVKLSDKAEVSNSCVTSAVLIANILSDVPDLASEISKDLPFLEGLLDIFPFASDDVEARRAIWSIIMKLLVQIKEHEMSPSSLHQYVLILANKSDLIEDDLLDRQLSTCDESKNSINSGASLDTRSAALQRIVSILNKWIASKDCPKGDDATKENYVDNANIHRLLDCCHKYLEYAS